MDELKTNNIYWLFFKYLIAISLSVTLLELSGIDATKANIVSFEKFSFAILILFSICLCTFFNMLNSIIKNFNKSGTIASLNKRFKRD